MPRVDKSLHASVLAVAAEGEIHLADAKELWTEACDGLYLLPPLYFVYTNKSYYVYIYIYINDLFNMMYM